MIRLVVRVGPKVEKSTHATLEEALDAVRTRLADVRPQRKPAGLIGREITPVQQVAARAEVRGPRGGRGGVDLRGDGSAEAFTGRVRREVVALEPGEDAPAALLRALRPRV